MNTSHLCRSCMKELSSWECENFDNRFINMFTFCTNIQIPESDRLPKQFCYDCTVRIESSFAYIQEAQRVNRVLQNIQHGVIVAPSSKVGMLDSNEHDEGILDNNETSELISSKSKVIGEKETAQCKNKKNIDSEKYECSVCKKKFLSKVWFEKHMRNQHGGKKYSCSQCVKMLSILVLALIVATASAGNYPNPDTDPLVFIANPVEANMPGHWLPLSIVKFFLERGNPPIHLKATFKLKSPPKSPKPTTPMPTTPKPTTPNPTTPKPTTPNPTTPKPTTPKPTTPKPTTPKPTTKLTTTTTEPTSPSPPDTTTTAPPPPPPPPTTKASTIIIATKETLSTKKQPNRGTGAFRMPSQLAVHGITHSQERKFVCACGKRYKRRKELNIHSRTHSDDRPYQCDHCNMRFKLKSVLKSHLVLHQPDKPYLCYICGWRFAQAGNLTVHMRTHSGAKPFVCACGFRAAAASSLRRHEMGHRALRPHTCRTCRKAFRDAGALTRHERSHTGARPYQCPGCSRAFTDSWKRKTHLMRAHRVPLARIPRMRADPRAHCDLIREIMAGC